MTPELERWSDDAPELFAEAKRSYGAIAPNDAQLEQMLAGVEACVAADPSVAVAGVKTSAGIARGVLKLVTALALSGAALWFSLPRSELGRQETQPVQAPQASQALSAHAEETHAPTPPTETHTEPAEAPTPSRRAPKNHKAKIAPLKEPAQTFEVTAQADPVAELELLRRARRVMLKTPARALEIVEEHRSLYPQGMLAEERELLAIEALLGNQLKDAATLRARLFKHNFPNSVHGPKLQSLLNTAP